MKLRAVSVFLALFSLIIAWSGPVEAQWVKDGIPVTDHEDPANSSVVTDGSRGAIFVWQIWEDTERRIYAQRINASGVIQWTAGGDSVTTVPGDQNLPAAISDGAGGVIVSWVNSWGDEVHELFYDDIYVQRIDENGNLLWGPGGVLVRSDSTGVLWPKLALDSSGGVVITWPDRRSETNWDIYAQRVDNTGLLQWAANGVGVCLQSGDQVEPRIISDGVGGSIISWQDYRSGDYDIYAERLDQYGTALWSGAAVCVYPTYNQTDLVMVSDDAGGVIIVWLDSRHLFSYLYGQRLDSTGTSQWTSNGILMHTEVIPGAAPEHHGIARDGSGGVFVTWSDARNYDDSGVYAQHFDSSGNNLWSSDLKVCDEPGNQSEPEIASREGGGAAVTWKDERAGDEDIFAQIFDSTGTLLLSETGGAVCINDYSQNRPILASDEAEGAIIAWFDYRTVTSSLYAQHVGINDGWYTTDPEIISIDDIYPDQGGWARINLAASIYDQAEAAYVATGYNVWRKMDGAVMAGVEKYPDMLTDYIPMACSDEELLKGITLYGAHAATIGLPPGSWESVAYVPAIQDSLYYIAVPTRDDSASSGIPWETYVVSVHTTEPSFYLFSEPDSGYSVDNIAPEPPAGLAVAYNTGSGNQLSWDRSPESDFHMYRIYRSTDPDFIPGSGNLVKETTTESWSDPDYDGWDVYYKVSALDEAGNESEAASPGSTTGDESPGVPKSFALYQNAPNPFNPSTRIVFDLPSPVHVKLFVFNVNGELVSRIINRRMAEGRKKVSWNATDSRGNALASGVYFYRLEAGDFVQTRKMVLMR